MWHRTIGRWVDAEKIWKLKETRLRAVFDEKLAVVKDCRDAWPAYAKIAEDRALRRAHWDEKYGLKRLVFHDDTNINMKFKPSSAELQSLTYSDYYGGNCAKGGVAVQPCGWIRVYQLFTGGASDTYYLSKCGAMELQESFAALDLLEDGVTMIPFTNVLDKGYRCTVTMFRHGKQEVLQPTFKFKDRRFTATDTLTTASIASDRAGNERAVNRLKTSSYLREGIEQNQDFERTTEVWLVYGFQVNFMYNAVM